MKRKEQIRRKLASQGYTTTDQASWERTTKGQTTKVLVKNKEIIVIEQNRRDDKRSTTRYSYEEFIGNRLLTN